MKHADYSWLAGLFFGLLILLLGAGTVQAGYQTWTETGPYGGPLSAGGMSPNYFTDREGAFSAADGTYRTQDGGNTWKKMFTQVFERHLIYVLNYPNPGDKTIFTIGDSDGALYKIVNWGTPVKISTPLGYINRIAISPNFAADHTIFLACGDWDDNGYPTNGGIIKSTDGGATWPYQYRPTDTYYDWNSNPLTTNIPFYSVALPPNYDNGSSDPSKKRVIAQGWIGENSASSFFFFDGNSTWSNPFLTGCGYCSGDPASFGYDIVFDPGFNGDTNTYFYIQTWDLNSPHNNSGVLRTDMSLSPWTVLPIPGANTAGFEPYMSDLNLEVRDNTLYAGGHWWNDTENKFYGGLWSTDLSTFSNWVPLSDSLDDKYVRGFVVSPTFSSDHTIYLATTSGMYRTTTGGNYWNLLNTGHKSFWFPNGAGSLNTSPNTYFIASWGGGVFKSTDSGNSWTPKNGSGPNVLGSYYVWSLKMSPNYNGTTDRNIFAVCSTYDDPWGTTLIYYSIDGGESWNPSATFNPALGNDSIAIFEIPQDFDGSTNKTLFFTTDWGQLYQSIDGGANWNLYPLPSPLTGIYTATFTTGRGTASNTWVMAGYDSGGNPHFYVSTNKGNTWNEKTTTGLFSGSSNYYYTSPLVPPGVINDTTILMPLAIYNGTTGAFISNGIYKSTNLGDSWTKVKSFNYDTALVPAWYSNPPIFFSTMWDNYPSSTDHGIWKSTDNGATWAKVGTDVTGFNGTGGCLYAPVPPGQYLAGYTLYAAAGRYTGFWQYSFASAPVAGSSNYYLQNGTVTPANGVPGDSFAYMVHYFNPGVIPTSAKVYIDGVGYDMYLAEGVPYDGVYHYSTALWGMGAAHTYYFSFTFGSTTARLPGGTDTFSGPTVGLGASTITLNVSPNPVLLGQPLTLSGNIIPPFAAPVDLIFTFSPGLPEETKRVVSCASNADGSFSYQYYPDQAGAWNVVAQWYGNTTTGGAASPATIFPIAVNMWDEQAYSMAFDYANNKYLVAIQGDENSPYNHSVRLIDPTTTPPTVGSKILIRDQTTGAQRSTQGSASVAFDGTRYFMIWGENPDNLNPPGAFQIYGQFINTSGVPVKWNVNTWDTTNGLAPFVITPGNNPWCHHPDNTQSLVYGGGKYLVVWNDDRHDLTCPATLTCDDKAYRELWGQLINAADGTPFGLEFLISSQAGSPFTPVYGDHAGVAYDNNNKFLVAWVDKTSNTKVYGTLIDATNGSVGSGAFIIDDSLFHSDNLLYVLFDGTRYVVSFQDETASGIWSTYVRLVSTAGVVDPNKITLSEGETFMGGAVFAFDGANYLAGRLTGSQASATTQGKFLDSNFNSLTPWINLMTTGSDNKLPMGTIPFYDSVNGRYVGVATKAMMYESENGYESYDGDVYGVFISKDPTPYLLKANGAASDSDPGTPGSQPVSFTVTPAGTTITINNPLAFNSNLNYPVTIAGQLTSGCSFCNLSSLDVEITVTPPSGPVKLLKTRTYDAAGNYAYTTTVNDGVFNALGAWTVKARFYGNNNFADSLYSSPDVSVNIEQSAGYAILVQGKITTGEGLALHNLTTNRVYEKLVGNAAQGIPGRGFLPQDIYYFNYNVNQDGVDGLTTKTGIQTAIQTWAKDKMNLSPAPLYIVFVDHGDTEKFMIASGISSVYITPTDLDTWLNTLEAGLSPAAQEQKIFFIYGACKSGSFLPKLSRASKPNRIIITSTDAPGDSYRGPLEDVGGVQLREGDLFTSNFFDYATQPSVTDITKAKTIKEAFQAAAQDIEFLMASINYGAQAGSSYQKPLLDDNHDGVGSNQLSGQAGSDGSIVATLRIGRGDPQAGLKVGNISVEGSIVGTQPIRITNATPTIQALISSGTATDFWLQVRPPGSYQYTTNSSIDPKILEFPAFAGQDQGGGVWKWDATINNNYNDPAHGFNGFTEPGLYQLVFIARGNDDNYAPTKSAFIYRYDVSPPSPNGFDLLTYGQYKVTGPDGINNGQLNPNQPWLFTWDVPSGTDPVTYTIYIGITDVSCNFTSFNYYQEGLIATSLFLDPLGPGVTPFTNGVKYSWRVIAVNSQGGSTPCNQGCWDFTVNSTNSSLLTPYIVGFITDATTKEPIINATINESSYSRQTTSGAPNGQYVMALPTGATGITNLTVNAGSGYHNATASVNIPSGGGTANKDFALTPSTTGPSITSLSPNCGNASTQVTINGAKFGTTTGKVKFNGEEATVTPGGWTDTKITVNAPAPLKTGPVVVTAGELKSNVNQIFTNNTDAPSGSMTLLSANAADSPGYSTSSTVKAVLVYSNATEVCFRNDPAASWGSWQALSPPGTGTSRISQSVASGEGTRTLYAKFRNCGSESGVESATIIVDTTAPSGGSVKINDGAAYTNDPEVTLTLNAADGGTYPSGVAYVMISNVSGFTAGNDTSEWLDLSDTNLFTHNATWQTTNDNKWPLQDATLSPFYFRRTVYVKFKDKAGKISSSYSAYITLDKANPTGSIKINSGADTTSSRTVTLTLTYADKGAGLETTPIRFTNVKDDWSAPESAWQASATTKTWTLSDDDGTKTVYYQIKDKAGNITELSESIQYFSTALGSLALNNGDQFTIKTSTTLAFTWESGYTHYQLKNDAASWGTTWTAIPSSTNNSSSKSYTLPSTNGLRTVYIRYKRASPESYSPEYSTSIYLDNKAPTGSVVIDQGTITNIPQVTLTLTADDPLVNGYASGVTKMAISNYSSFSDLNLSDPNAWLNYAEHYDWTLIDVASGKSESCKVYVKFKDAAGNVSSAYSASITIDKAKPTGTVKINSGATTTTSRYVTLSVSASDTGSGEDKIYVINANPSENIDDWAPYDATVTTINNWDLFAAPGNSNPGEKTVYLMVKDKVGNYSNVVSATITYQP